MITKYQDIPTRGYIYKSLITDEEKCPHRHCHKLEYIYQRHRDSSLVRKTLSSLGEGSLCADNWSNDPPCLDKGRKELVEVNAEEDSVRRGRTMDSHVADNPGSGRARHTAVWPISKTLSPLSSPSPSATA